MFSDTPRNRKSQLAISYGHKVHQAHPETWIFWIDAESVSKFEQGYRAIADEVRIAGRSDKDADILNLVYEWLRNANNGNWVLILDNANNKDVFTSQPSASHQAQSEKQLQDFLPRSSNGSILVTSRSREAAFMVTCNYKHIFTVEQMSENEAMALLQSHLDEAHDEDEMKRLLEMLGNVPLAVAQAAANISRRSLSMSEYRQELHKGDEFSPGTLDESTPQLRRDSTRSNSIVATWRITFEYVRRTAPSAARLLSLMCLFDHQEIPQSLLEGQYCEEVNASPLKSRKVWWKRRLRMERRKQPTVPPKSLPPTFEDDWLILRDFSLIKPNKDKKHFSMHPLVQFITGKWLVSHGEHECWSYQYISIISAQLGVAELEGRLKKGPLLAHAYAAVPYRPSDTAIRPLQDWGVITFGIAMYYHQRLAWDLALKLLHVAAEAFELTLGNGAPQVLRCNTERGNIYSNLKQYTEAEIMHRRTLDIHSQLLGVEHPDTLVSMTRVGDALADLRRDAEADELYRKFLEMHVTTLGPLHPDTQEAFTTCGMFYFLRGRKKDAYDMFRQAHEAKCQGKNDYYDMSWPSRIRGIGLNFQLKGNLEQAELYYREAVSEMEKGAEEHDLIECINHLANVLLQQENFAEAEGLYQRAMAWYDAQDLKKHEECLRTMRDLAFVLLKLDKYEAAEQVAMKCLSEAEEKYGSDPVETLPITWILGCVLEKQHHYEASLQLLKQAFEGAKEKQGENHADTNMFESDYTRLFEKLRNITPETRSKSQSVLLGPHSNNDTLGGAEADDRVSEVDITANE
jgi:tetratricopeptide (TPR) repeat protein